jgi:magnesium chelatase subunit I
MEIILWGLTINNKLDKSDNNMAYKFDSIGVGQHFYGNN